MRGHQWNSVEGTIVDFESRRHEHTYTIDAWNGRGLHVRGTVRHKSPTAYPVGSKVRIEIDEHNQMRFDPSAPGGDPLIATMSMSDQIAEAAAAFDQPSASRGPDFGTARGGRGGRGGVIMTSGEATIHFDRGAGDLSGLAGGLAGLAGLAGAIGNTNAHVIGPDGQQVPIDPAEIAQLTQAMLSGDLAAKQAAIERLHQIGATSAGQQASNLGSGALGQGRAADAAPGAAPGASAEQRLTALEHLLNRGLLTQAEYESQRQRIIDSI
jgi:hypothetical protein